MKEDVFYGKINNAGDVILDLGMLKSFTNQFPGKRVAVSVKILDADISKNFADFYRAYILPKARVELNRMGYSMFTKDVDIFLRESCPVMEGNGGGVRDIDDLSVTEMHAFIDQIVIHLNDIGIPFLIN